MQTLNTRESKVISYMKDNGIEILDKNIIRIGVQEKYSMAIVEVNDKCLMLGNYWDFHRDCHGMKVPEFSSYRGLADLFKEALEDCGKSVETVVDKTWIYDEDED